MKTHSDTAKDYEEIINPQTDNAYLYYIHYRIGHANKLLEQIKTGIHVIAAGVVICTLKVVGFF